MVYLEHSNRVGQVSDRKSNDSQNPQKGALKKKRKCHITHSTAEYSNSTQSLPRRSTFILHCNEDMSMYIQLHAALCIGSGHTYTHPHVYIRSRQTGRVYFHFRSEIILASNTVLPGINSTRKKQLSSPPSTFTRRGERYGADTATAHRTRKKNIQKGKEKKERKKEIPHSSRRGYVGDKRAE